MEAQTTLTESQLQEAQSRVDALLAHESNLVWNRYNVFLVANTMFIAAAGVFVSQPGLDFVQNLLCICGILTCVIWFLLTLRGFVDCGNYYSLSYSLEAQRFPQQLRIHAEIATMTKRGASIRIRNLALLSIVLFSLPNIVFIVIAILRFGKGV